MLVSKKAVAEKMGAYLHHEISLAQLVDWAEQAIMEGDFEEAEIDVLRSVISRLGVADVRTFGLTWEDCQDLLKDLGYSARVEVLVA